VTGYVPPRPDQLLTVAICTRNRGPVLQQCAEIVLRQIDDDTELLIVDNASTDSTREVGRALAATHSCVRVVTEPRVGLSHGRNAALAAARSRYVAFLDDDVLAEPGWLAGYRRFLERPPADDLAAAGGTVVPCYGAPPPSWLPLNAYALHVADLASPTVGPSWPWGCNFVCHRDRALEVGGFCAQLGRRGSEMGTHEETDLFHRLHRAGYSVWWLPHAPIRHLISPDRLKLVAHFSAAFAAGRSTAILRLRQSQGPRQRCGLIAWRLLTTPVLCVMYLLTAGTTAAVGRWRAAVKGMASLARSLGMLWQLTLHSGRVLLRGW
jgi:glycosyltransferase involved in cell wall biosynthesis